MSSFEREVLEFEFCQWLTENGAKFSKIQWPSSQTEGGVRGAIALDDISSLEPMLEIPTSLMMAPPVIFKDEVIGAKLQASLDLLQGDLLLTVFVMHEMIKKEKSFYYPYLRILPEPGNVSEWTNDELLELQDNEVILRTKSRQRMLVNMYQRTIVGLSRKYPQEFPVASFTFELFKFSWNTIQARAFGRRLKWTALVPFADCLNHNNVQTKYDCDIDGNGVFRLFPSGENHYKKGKEVFNSYGRRPNENLLTDYGFAMLHNEWDEVELSLELPDHEPNYDFKRRALYSMGMHANKRFKLRKYEVPFEALIFLRIVSMTEADTNKMHAREVADIEAMGGYPDVDEFDEDEAYNFDITIDNNLEGLNRKTKQDGKASGVKMELPKYYDKMLSVDNEMEAIKLLINILEALGTTETTIEEDEQLLQKINEAREREELELQHSNNLSNGIDITENNKVDFKFSWKLWSAVHYRLTRKYIIANVKSLVKELLHAVSFGYNDEELCDIFDRLLVPSSDKTIKPRLVKYKDELLSFRDCITSAYIK